MLEAEDISDRYDAEVMPETMPETEKAGDRVGRSLIGERREGILELPISAGTKRHPHSYV
jgi:hypothetical protein